MPTWDASQGEFGQNFVPGRSLEVADEMFNTLGVVSGMAIASEIGRTRCQIRRSRSSQS